MEPSKNTNNISASNNEPLEPVFRGMPKPGQAFTPNSNFSAHTPSALDRLMNPNIDNQVSPTPTSTQTQTPVSRATLSKADSLQSNTLHSSEESSEVVSTMKPSFTPSEASNTPASSSFKPYTVPPVTSGYKVVTPASSASTFSSAPSTSVIAGKLGNEVNSILNRQQEIPKDNKKVYILSVGISLVLLLIAGGLYYWYTAFYLPNAKQSNVSLENQPSSSGVYNQNTDTSRTSVFPSGVTRSTATSSAVSAAPTVAKQVKPTNQNVIVNPPKNTRVAAPFTQTQRDIVSSYIFSNINALAPQKSKKSYEVTDITFDGPDRAIVEYTNGSSSYIAVAVATIEASGNVRVVSFSPLEK
jgi:hypothetical protein